MNVSIIGTGYVGLTTGACLAFLGHKVTCIDADERKVKALQAGKIPFYEPHLPELVAGARHNLSFTTEYAQPIPSSQVIFIAVGTPPGQNGAPDLKYLEAAARGIGEYLSGDFVVVVNKSTVPIGSGNWVESIVRDAYEKRTSKKSYVARVWGHVDGDSGLIDLPLATDWENKPRQRIDHEGGRASRTQWEVLSREAGGVTRM